MGNIFNNENPNPFIVACEKGNLEDVILFLANNPELLNQLKIPSWGMKCTGLIAAAYYGHTEICKLLLDKVVWYIQLQNDNDGSTPLDWAAKKGHTEVVELLKAHMGKFLKKLYPKRYQRKN